MKVLAKFPLVTLEKWQGVQAFSTTVCQETGNCNASNIFYWQEDAWVAAAKQIKAASPNTSVVVWMDTVLIYTGWTWPEVPHHKHEPWKINYTWNPDAQQPCTTGHFRAAEFLESHKDEYLLQNQSDLPSLEPWSGCHVYDHTKATVRQYWMDMCLNLTLTGVIDGCGADFSATGKNRWYFHNADYIAKWLLLDNVTAVAWSNGHRQMMRDTTHALGDGLLIGKDGFELGDHVNAVLHENCPASNGTILLLRNLTATAQKVGRRLVYQCHAKRPSESGMAAFLCGAGRDHFYSIGGWNGGRFSDHWLESFARPLGKPSSDCMYNHRTQTWTRIFSSGTVVRFNSTTNEGMIEWNDNRQENTIRSR